MDLETECDLTPPELRRAAEIASINLLPEKSRNLYQDTYTPFQLSKKYNCSLLWQKYSMLKSTVKIYENINIGTFAKLQAYLKRQNEGFTPKKANTFSPENVNNFIRSAPDEKFLATKVALIMGIMGACRSNELYNMKIKDIEDINSCYIVKVPTTKTKIVRKFTVTDNFYNIIKKYVCIRNHMKSDYFFLNFQNGKCTKQRIGINKFTKMGRDIANFLKIPNPEQYTGHSFRRTSATILVDAGGDITALKRHGGWKSTVVAEGYINDSLENKKETARKILYSVESSTQNLIATSAGCTKSVNLDVSNQNVNLNVASIPSIILNNCSNVTVNITSNK